MKKALGRGGARPRGRSKTPRFDVRFEAGHGLLRLARPLDAGVATFETLELSLGRIAFPIDLTDGPARFRTRRTRVRRATARVEPRRVVDAAAARGVRLVIGEDLGAGVVRLAVRDEFGVIGVDLVPITDGTDLLFAPIEIRSVLDGPATPLHRALVAARSLGLTVDDASFVLRLARPFRVLFAGALVRAGYRLPDERGVEIAPPRIVDGTVVLELGAHLVAEPGDAILDAEEAARARAPIFARLAEADVDGALVAAEALRDKIRGRPGASEREREVADAARLSVMAEVPGLEREVLGALEGREDPLSVCASIRLALRVNDFDRAQRAAELALRVEPIAELAAEAVVALARRMPRADAARALELVSRAASRKPDDAELALERVELARLAADTEALRLAAQKALAAPLAGRERARIAVAAASAFDRLGAPEEAEEAYREALFAAPDDPAALQGLAGLFAARGDRAAAVSRLDRAARSARDGGDPVRAALALHRASALLVGAGRLAAAEARLERAAELQPSDPALACALARVRITLGDAGAVGAAYGRLLTHRSGGAALEHALVEAACYHLDEREDCDAARPFVEALERRAPNDARLGPLRHRLYGGDAPPRAASAASAMSTTSQPPSASDSAAEASAPAVDAHARTELVALADLDTDPGEAPRSAPERARERYELFSRTGRRAEAALALAEHGAALRDTATLRAAVDLAEAAGDEQLTLRVIDLVLEVVGDGPARDALLRRRARIEAPK